MTNKQRILKMVERWADDISFDQALYHMHVMKEVMESIKEVEEGHVLDFDEVFDELERVDYEEKDAASSVAKSRKEPEGITRPHSSQRLPKNGEVVRGSPKKVRTPAS